MNETQPTPFKPLDQPDELQYWQFVAGDYGRHKNLYFSRSPFLLPDSGVKFESVEQWLREQAEYKIHLESLRIDELRGCELSFKEIIDFYLEKNKTRRKPTIAMDVGSMAGTSWIRLGNLFREQVQNGELVLVATNRTYSPEVQGFSIPKMPEESKEFVERNHNLVQYFVADASNFSDLSITLPNDEPLILMNNVDFVHESDSLSRYSPDPEKEIEILARMVSENGIYLSYGGIPYSDHLPKDILLENPRFVAILNAHRNLVLNLGFSLVTQVEDGTKKGTDLIYAVFKKTGAPSIRTD